MKLSQILLLFILLFTVFRSYADNEWARSYVPYEGSLDIKVYRNISCNCCQKWMKHLKQNNFNITDIPTNNLAYVNEQVHLPAKMKSSHTAIINGYIIEGHVPADDIKRLLLAKPDIRGLAVPRMPAGVPGAERGEIKESFIVFQFDKNGKYSIFNRYQVDKNNHYQAHPVTEVQLKPSQH